MSATTLRPGAVVTSLDDGRRAARFVWISLGATGAGAVLGTLYFAQGGLFGPLSDVTGAVMGVALAPVAVHVWRTQRARAPLAAAVSLVAGLSAAALTGASSVGLILADTGVIQSEGYGILTAQFLGMGAIGAWLIAASAAARGSGLFRRRTARAAWVAGTCYLLVGVVEPLTGFAQTVMYSAGSVGLIGFGCWAVWAARDLARYPAGG